MLHSLSSSSVIINLSIFIFPIVAGWWCPTPIDGFSYYWKVKMLCIFKNVIFLRLGENSAYLALQIKIWGTLGFLKPIKMGRMESLHIPLSTPLLKTHNSKCSVKTIGAHTHTHTYINIRAYTSYPLHPQVMLYLINAFDVRDFTHTFLCSVHFTFPNTYKPSHSYNWFTTVFLMICYSWHL